jgi:hypothetical protein
VGLTIARDYETEKKHHRTAAYRADNAARTRARRKLIKQGRVSRGDGREIDHVDHNPQNNSPRNLRVVSKTTNRTKQPKRGPKKT